MATKDPNPERYDDREIDARSIVRFAVVLGVVTAGVLGFAWLFNGSLARSEQAGHAAPAPIATELPTAPPEPRLQPTPPDSLKALRAREEEALTSYRWVDADRGVVSIPITDAIDILARRGLPARAESPPQSTVTIPTHSSLTPPRAASSTTPPAEHHPDPQGGHP